VRYGLTLGADHSVIDEAREAEQLGFDYVASGEHLFFHDACPNPFVTLAAAAGATRHIRLVSTISLLPLYPAALVAKLVATLDQVSGGRFELGVGAGGEYPAEFVAAGVTAESRFRRLSESLEVMRMLFARLPVSFEGEFTRLDEVRLDPPPRQRPGPPIWLGGRKPGAVRRAARYADVWMPYMVTPERLAEGLAQVRSAAEDIGREPADIRGAPLSVARDAG